LAEGLFSLSRLSAKRRRREAERVAAGGTPGLLHQRQRRLDGPVSLSRKRGPRNQPFQSAVMVKVLLYACATGVFSSRKIAAKAEDVTDSRGQRALTPTLSRKREREPNAPCRPGSWPRPSRQAQPARKLEALRISGSSPDRCASRPLRQPETPLQCSARSSRQSSCETSPSISAP
jgi:hypothetical protein